MVSPSNLAYLLETAKDIGEHMTEEKAIIRKASYLLFNLVNLHPFLDGNKRTAFEVAKNFLKLNGWEFEPDEDDAFRMLVSIASGNVDADSTEVWVGSNLSKGGRGK